MSDDTEETEVEDEGLTYANDAESEYVEVEGAQIIAPRGWGTFADYFGAAAVRVRMDKGGSIEVLVQSGGAWSWKDPTKTNRSGTVAEIKPK